MSIFPWETSSRPAIRRSSVDLPQPEGPSSTTNFPFSARRLTASTAATPPKRLVTPSRTISDNAPPRLRLVELQSRRLDDRLVGLDLPRDHRVELGRLAR